MSIGSEHSFIFQEGAWEGQGSYTGEDGRVIRARLGVRSEHQPDDWRLASRWEIEADEPRRIELDYRITPFADDDNLLHWRAEHAEMGPLKGKFVVVGESILSLYSSVDGRRSAMEYLQRETARQYRYQGALFAGFRRLATWDLRLTRVD